MQSDGQFGLLITWTCYGTWLPGDARGHVSNQQVNPTQWLPKENAPGSPCRSDDPYAHAQASRRQQHATTRLDRRQAACVAASLVEAARSRKWRLLCARIMANHVHAVITDCPNDGPAVRRILKGTTQASLNRLAGAPHKWWTRGGSNRYLNGSDHIEAAMKYVEDQEFVLAGVDDMKILP